DGDQAAARTDAFPSITPRMSLFLHDQELFAVDLHLCARPFAKQNAIAFLHAEGNDLATFVARARAGSDDLGPCRFLFGCVRNDDATGRFHVSSMRRTTTRSCRGRNFMASTSVLESEFSLYRQELTE